MKKSALYEGQPLFQLKSVNWEELKNAAKNSQIKNECNKTPKDKYYFLKVILCILISLIGIIFIVVGITDFYFVLDKYGKAYYGAEVLSKNNTSINVAATFAEAKKQVALAKIRDFGQIIIGIILSIGSYLLYKRLSKKKANIKPDQNFSFE